MMQRFLKWNPNDNQGLRYLIGSEYLRAGDTARASKVISKEADHFPPYLYEAALIDLTAGCSKGSAFVWVEQFMLLVAPSTTAGRPAFYPYLSQCRRLGM